MQCEFVIGEPTNRKPVRLNERNGKSRTIVMKSGDAVFFDGGSVTHQVKRMLPGTAPDWWEGAKVQNGSRCVLKDVILYHKLCPHPLSWNSW